MYSCAFIEDSTEAFSIGGVMPFGTRNSIFLLSIEEVVCQYFGDSSSKLYNPGKNQRYWFERKDVNNSKRIARLEVNNYPIRYIVFEVFF